MMSFTDWIKFLCNHGKTLLKLQEALQQASKARAVVSRLQGDWTFTHQNRFYQMERALVKSKDGQVTFTLDEWRWQEGLIPDYFRLIDAELYPQYQPIIQHLSSIGYVCTHPKLGWWQKPGSPWLVVYRPHIRDKTSGVFECKLNEQAELSGKYRRACQFYHRDGKFWDQPASLASIHELVCEFRTWCKENRIC